MFYLCASGENRVYHIGLLTPMPVIKHVQYCRYLRNGGQHVSLQVWVFSRHFIFEKITNVNTGVFTTSSVLMLELKTWSQSPLNTWHLLRLKWLLWLTVTWLQETIWCASASWLLSTRCNALIAFSRNPGFFYWKTWFSNSWVISLPLIKIKIL